MSLDLSLPQKYKRPENVFDLLVRKANGAVDIARHCLGHWALVQAKFFYRLAKTGLDSG